MNTFCARCNAANDSAARFCQQCGATLAATTVQGRTVAMTPTQLNFNPKEVIERAHRSFGNETTYVGCATRPAAILNQREETFLLIDISGSMCGELEPGVTKREGAGRACINLALNKFQIDPDDLVGVMVFDDSYRILLEPCPIRANKPEMIRILQSLPAGGGTDLDEPLIGVRDYWDRNHDDAVRRIVMLTDGHGGDPLRTSEELKAGGVIIDVVGIGPNPRKVNEKLLKQLASIVEGELRYRFIKDHRTLVQHYTQLANKTATGA
ncbi:MAG: VWA domain-containing protein [Planctomycetes bacterium]|nr:VWA domain-containing protein [Planctomycetota bacterium]